MDALFSYEPMLRFAAFAGVLVLLALLESFFPRRERSVRRPWRWGSNLALLGINTLVIRLLSPLSTFGMALLAWDGGWGLLPRLDLPYWAVVVLAVVALDLIIYLQHVLFHAVPVLWRLHMVHHADLDFDVTTGLRFHTIEIIVSLGLKLGAVAALGAPPLAVLLFEVLLNATSMFNHANLRLPLWLDRVLRLFVVTPDMHRVHHSVLRQETNSNFGFNLPWWDLLFGTYRRQPQQGHEGMIIGLEQLRDEKQVDRLPGMLLLPWTGDVGTYPVGREEVERPALPGEPRVPRTQVAEEQVNALG